MKERDAQLIYGRKISLLNETIDALKRENERLRAKLAESLNHAEEHLVGCLYCGEDCFIDDEMPESHKLSCWYYKARAALDEVSK